MIYSRSAQDQCHCSCGKCFVDGGFIFHRFIGDGKTLNIKFVGKDPQLSLWIDWHGKYNQYGLIKDCKEKGITICMNQ